jgi:5-methylcytosine-specific restriction endonuclease McrA
MRALLAKKIIEQDEKCGICGDPFTDCIDIIPDHMIPKGMGSGNSDDHPDNIQAAHRRCNLEKGQRGCSLGEPGA